MEWIQDNAGWLWFVVAGVLAAVELTTLDLVLAMLALGAAGAGLAALLGAGMALQLVVFVLLSLLMFVAVRPSALRRLHRGAEDGTSWLERLEGRRVVAADGVGMDGGVITVDGDTWSARLEPGAPVAPAGAEVTVLQVDGATLVVRPVPVIDWDAHRPAVEGDPTTD